MAEQILGIDLGANSVGWSILEERRGSAVRIVASGVRVFEAGVEGDIESGRDLPRNAERRDARQHRRQLARRACRMRKVARALQASGLLPKGDVASETGRHRLLLELDTRLQPGLRGDDDSWAHVFPYRLRARALDERLEPWAVGRALYHLAQRRGYKSNRKAAREDDDERGTVKPAIAELAKHMAEAGARTLGEYFSRLNPREERIRGRWTSRAMYEAEFEAIWSAQAQHHPELLTDAAKEEVRQAIFFQRPLRVQKHLIGTCPYEEERRRAPLALLAAQRFRLLQQVNHTEVITPEGEVLPLTSEQRAALVSALEREGDLNFTKVRKLLGFTKQHLFNFGSEDEEKFIGNRTSAKLVGIFGERWWDLSDEDRNRVVDDLLSMENEEALAGRGVRAWGLDEAQAAAFATVQLEPGYCRLSRQALARLLPLMEAGIPYMTAVKQVYGVRRETRTFAALPPVDQALPELRNPVVHRCLTELRKVVNGVVREYGRPDIMRVELARDIKNTRKERKRISKQNLENKTAREKATARIHKEMGNPHPSRADIEKVLLAEECNWECPYTGKHISMQSLLGDAPQLDVEHIVPYSRCLDNSFLNKTLCYHEENRNTKRGRTPFEAYGGDPEQWEAILGRVKGFQGAGRGPKLQRFRLESLESMDDFTARQLNDTRYASREAAEYLGLLYGGAVDPEGRRRVQVSRGKVTADLRNAWKLNEILGDGPRKERDDHRHHAIDAIAIALADAGRVQRVSRAAEQAEKNGAWKWWRNLEMPWEGFLEDVRSSIEGITVSHRPDRRVRGALHDETLYSAPRLGPDGSVCVHVRKRIDALSSNEVEAIVDPVVRAAVVAALDGREPKKAFGAPGSAPCLVARDGRRIPIRRVRLRTSVATVQLAQGPRLRHVVPGANHHIEVLEVADAKGGTKWDAVMVPLYEACERLRRKQPVVQRDHGPARRFVFSLAPGDLFALGKERNGSELLIARTISQKKSGAVSIEYVRLSDARKKVDIKAAKEWVMISPNELRKRGCRKLNIDPLGRLTEAHD